ncbi:SIR2 family protein [Microbacterium sp. SORGH_AS_0862]|uniref:SIR2 family protein n=1 Tax=Microbacterium sp. SORGH_AS_0862 TaxID=3041789 RepID=UPI002791C192|nr:SIR2 family protein [Microbacterium sp. SORGH_AS_0862]MDQ1206082.1 hypothetical protein [Microbacterium sp. SORGH_AS_0862]
MTFAEDLVAHLNRLPAAPFLFVGSGFSRRFVGADDWAGLLRRFAEPTGNAYERYASAANGDFPRIATLIADDFHGVWWDSDAYADQRAANPAPRGRTSPLKIAIADYLSDAVSQLPSSGLLVDELAMLSKGTIEGIITTNYDEVLEHLFPDFAVFAGQDELLFHEPQGVGEIYKIHGSSAKPESLVVELEDYERFTRRNAYLAAKLLTIFVEHPVIFIGYSLTDDDVREILTSIAHILTNENLSKLQDRLIFIHPLKGEDAQSTVGAIVQPVSRTWCELNPSMPLTDCMGVTPGTYPGPGSTSSRMVLNNEPPRKAPNLCWYSPNFGNDPASTWSCTSGDL